MGGTGFVLDGTELEQGDGKDFRFSDVPKNRASSIPSFDNPILYRIIDPWIFRPGMCGFIGWSAGADLCCNVCCGHTIYVLCCVEYISERELLRAGSEFFALFVWMVVYYESLRLEIHSRCR